MTSIQPHFGGLYIAKKPLTDKQRTEVDRVLGRESERSNQDLAEANLLTQDEVSRAVLCSDSQDREIENILNDGKFSFKRQGLKSAFHMFRRRALFALERKWAEESSWGDNQASQFTKRTERAAIEVLLSMLAQVLQAPTPPRRSVPVLLYDYGIGAYPYPLTDKTDKK